MRRTVEKLRKYYENAEKICSNSFPCERQFLDYQGSLGKSLFYCQLRLLVISIAESRPIVSGFETPKSRNHVLRVRRLLRSPILCACSPDVFFFFHAPRFITGKNKRTDKVTLLGTVNVHPFLSTWQSGAQGGSD